jgi:flagellar protein FliO/FliZ
MPKFLTRAFLVAVPSLHLGLLAAQEGPQAAAPKAFAAPGTAASLPSGTAGGIGQATLALLVVLALIFGIAWMARRLRNVTRGTTQGIDVLAQAAVGPRERVVIVRVGNARLLLGVAPGRITHLHDLPADVALDNGGFDAGARAPSLVDSFRSLMNKGGRGQGK